MSIDNLFEFQAHGASRADIEIALMAEFDGQFKKHSQNADTILSNDCIWINFSTTSHDLNQTMLLEKKIRGKGMKSTLDSRLTTRFCFLGRRTTCNNLPLPKPKSCIFFLRDMWEMPYIWLI